MHIPDGYLGPKTCVLFYIIMLPVWAIALKKVEKELKAEKLPLLAFGAAFTFVVMMFNFPIPGGTTGHIVGSTLIAIVIGPFAGVLSMSLVLFLQAILFADGGITTFAANAFNMAFVMSFVGYYTFKLLNVHKKTVHIALFAAAFVAVNAASIAAAVELGVQPLLERLNGTALYFPYPLSVTLPALIFPHLLFFGPIEGIGTVVIASYFFKTREELLYKPVTARIRPLWLIIIFMIILSPLGLIARGTPWGEWGREELKALIGYVPQGFEMLDGIWNGLMPAYAIAGIDQRAGYVLSAFIGSGLVVLSMYLVGRLWRR